MFLAELNNLEIWGADIGNAYLQALIREKLYIVGGPEFELLQGHVLVMYKALNGTRSCQQNSLTYSITWVSSLQEQTQTYG